jgi:hypothetical protein
MGGEHAVVAREWAAGVGDGYARPAVDDDRKDWISGQLDGELAAPDWASRVAAGAG